MSSELTKQAAAREQAQNDHLVQEQQAFDEVCRNLDYKRQQFQLNYQITHFTAQIGLFERRVKLLSEKKMLLTKELNSVSSVQEREIRKMSQELSDLTAQLGQAKAEFEQKHRQWQQLKGQNDDQIAQNWEHKIEDLEAQLRRCERQRTQAQLNLESFHSSLQMKLSLLSDPHEDIAAPARDYFLNKRDKINQEVKQRAEQRVDLKRRLDELRREKHAGESRDALIEAYRKSYEGLDTVSSEIDKQILDLTNRISQCRLQMDER